MKKFLLVVIVLSVILLLLMPETLAGLKISLPDFTSRKIVSVEHREQQRTANLQGLKDFSGGVGFKPDANAFEGSPALTEFVPYRWRQDSSETVNFWTNQLTYAIDQIISVKNTGNQPVYVRTVFAFEHTDAPVWKNVCSAGSSTGMVYHGSTIINGKPFELYSYDYDLPLQPGEISWPSLLQIVMDANATPGDYQTITEGYELMSSTLVCQAEGVEDLSSSEQGRATSILNAILGEITPQQHPWLH